MRIHKLAMLGLVLAPLAVAPAQRGGGGGAVSRERGEKAPDWKSINEDKGIKLSNGDVEDMSPLKLLIDKRKDLKLTDDQLKNLKDLEAKLKTKVEPSFKALDSLRRASQPPLHDPSDEDRSRMMSARRGFGEVVKTIRESYDASEKDAVALLDESQKPKATELLDKQRKDTADTIRQKLGGGRG